MLESTEAFKKFANGKSWLQLDFQTQQQIRLAAILEQAYARYGDTLADTTQSRHNQFIASLKNVQLTLGQAFLPIYNAVLPPLTAFMNTLARVISYIGAFTSALFGKPTQAKQQADAVKQQADAVSALNKSVNNTSKNLDKASKSAKKAKKEIGGLIGGLDEINNLSVSTTAGTSDKDSDSNKNSSTTPSIGRIGDIGTIDMGNAIDTSELEKKAEKIRGIFEKIGTTIRENKSIILALCAGLVAGIGSYFVISKWGTITSVVGGVFIRLANPVRMLIETLQGVARFGIQPILQGFFAINPVILGVAAVIGTVVAALVYLWNTNEDFKNNVIKTWNNIQKALKPWIEGLIIVFRTLADIVVTVLGAAFKILWKVIVKVVEVIANVVMYIANECAPVFEALGEVFKYLAEGLEKGWKKIKKYFGELEKVFENEGLLAGAKKLFIDGLSALFNLLPDDVRKPLEKIIKNVVNFAKKIQKRFRKIKYFIIQVKDSIEKNGLKKTIELLLNRLKKKIKDKLVDMKDEFIKKIKDHLKEMGKTLQEKWDEIVDSVKDFFINIGSKVEDFKEKVAEKWDEVKDWAKDKFVEIGTKFEDFKEKASDKWDGVKDWFKDKVLNVNTDVEGFEGKVSNEIDKTNETTSKKKISIKNIVEDIQGKVSNAWEIANEWVGKQKINIGNKVEDIKTKVSQNLDKAKKWLKTQSVQVGTKVGEFKEKASQNLSKAKKWLNTQTLQAGTKVGSFYSKVKDAFEETKKKIKSWAFNIGLKVTSSVSNIKEAVNKIIDSVNKNVIAKLQIKLPTGGTLGPPKIPKLAKGGIIDNPTLAMVGEAGRKFLRSIVEMRYKKYSVNSWKAKSKDMLIMSQAYRSV